MIYNFNNYEIEADKAVKIVIMFYDISPKISYEKIINFLYRVEHGEYGVLYKMPTCILAMFQKYVNETGNIVPKFLSGPDK